MQAYKQSFLLTRLATGVSFFGHGLVRLPKLDRFSHGMMGEFQHSILPHALVLYFGYFLPFAELTIGLLLLAGLFTGRAAMAGAILMILLIFGTTTIEQWAILPTQLLHFAFLAGILVFADHYDYCSLDLLLRHRIDGQIDGGIATAGRR